MRLLTPSEAAVAWWTVRALRALRRRLRAGVDVHSDAATPAPPPRSALDRPAARRVADAVLTRGRATCLERAVVEQALDLRWGVARDVVIGVRGGSRNFAAHAWLDGEPDEGYTELSRRPATRATA